MSRLLPVVRAGSAAGRRALARLAGRGRRVLDRRVTRQAERLVEDVRRRGDKALLAAARSFDGSVATTAAELALGPPDLAAELRLVPPALAEAIELAIERVERFHRPQVAAGYRLEEDGLVLEERRLPLARVGVYVPGGRASYPSTVVMTVVPARLAGVAEIAVATPPAAYAGSPALRYALARLGITEVWGMGGAHAVAALAHGTETIRRVDKIVGPGNAWVTAAKRRVAGEVAIDGLAGPTEVVILAGEEADPALLAADLLAQAEHDPLAAAVLVTPSRSLARAVETELAAQLPALATADTARAALAAFGRAFLVESWEEALSLVEEIAPEHLQLVGAEAGGARAQGALRRCGVRGCGRGRGPRRLPRRPQPRAPHLRLGALRLGPGGRGLRAPEPRGEGDAGRRRAPGARGGGPGPGRGPAGPCRSGGEEAGVSAVRSVAELVRPEVRRARAYHLDLAPCRFKLDQNEVPWDLPRAVKRRIAERLLELDFARYPDFHGDALREALSRHHGHPAAGILVGNGSNELLGVALEAVAGPGAEVLALRPGFEPYRMMIERTGAAARFLGPRADLRLPWAELLAEVARDPRRPVLLTQPQQPHGRGGAGPRGGGAAGAARGAAAARQRLRRVLDRGLPAAPRPPPAPDSLPHLLQGLVARRPAARLPPRRRRSWWPS